MKNIETDEIINKSKELLHSVKREGMEELINYLEKSGYFESPGSSKFHGNFKHGLIIHSFNLYSLFKSRIEEFKIDFQVESIIICAFLHDLCKVGLYIITKDGAKRNSDFSEQGHSKLSIRRAERFIKLNEIEKEIIQFHMGPYGTTDFAFNGEYTLKEMVDTYSKNNIAKLFYFCDDMSSMFLEKTN
jgi:hypothetical protein